jgi:uridine kinase
VILIITGPQGSGKTQLCEAIQEMLADKVSTLVLDPFEEADISAIKHEMEQVEHTIIVSNADLPADLLLTRRFKDAVVVRLK